MTHIMLDIETWGKTPGCDIRSIGAVVFDPVAGMLSTDKHGPLCFYIATDNPLGRIKGLTDKLRAYPLTRDPETVQWWSNQSADAQAAFENPVDLHIACVEFAIWLDELSVDKLASEDQTLRVWANDPHFDCSILAAVFRSVGINVPWHYRSPRSQKTITDAAGMTHDDYAPFNHGTAHNALDDAISQAKIVCEAYRRLGLQK